MQDLLIHHNDEIKLTNQNFEVTEVKNTSSDKEVNYYRRFSSVDTSECSCGYYFSEDKYQKPKRLTNFTITLAKQIKATYDQKVCSFFSGRVNIEGCDPIFFDNFLADYLSKPADLKSFIHNLCGTKVAFLSDSLLSEAIKSCNRDIDVFEAFEFGYDPKLEKYYTPEFIISKDGIERKETPIKYDDIGITNYLGFNTEDEFNISEVVDFIFTKLLKWDSPGVSLTSFSFAMLPVIYPFVSKKAGSKPYMALVGQSGCGKTTLARFLQNLYGNNNTLETFTSTTNAIQIRGNSFKDALFVVDDLKLQNINSEYSRNQLMAMFQNYSDGTSRNRANVNLHLKDNKSIKGMLLITAEDIPFTESSTFARGIFIDLPAKEINYEKRYIIESNQEKFRFLTKSYIQFVLMNINNLDLIELFMKNQKYIDKVKVINNIEGDNLPRLINNFSLLKTSWDVIYRFAEPYIDTGLLNMYNEQFLSSIEDYFIKNSKRIQVEKPDAKFEETLWTLIENEKMLLVKFSEKENLPYGATKDSVAGLYEITADNKVKVCIRFKHVFHKIRNHLRANGNDLGHSFEVILEKLICQNKIYVNNSGVVTFKDNKTHRGVYWLGEIPWENVGICLGLDEVKMYFPQRAYVPIAQTTEESDEYEDYDSYEYEDFYPDEDDEIDNNDYYFKN